MDGAGDGVLAEQLAALSSPTRLALLRTLRVPRILTEIEVRSGESTAADRGPIARQSVRKHLDALIEAGLVTAIEVVRENRELVEFVVNPQAMYALAEEVREFARLKPTVLPADQTISRGAGAAGRPTARPAFIVAKGVEEGASFDLRVGASGQREWLIGRRRGLEVSLDFDPYVSAVNSRVTWRERTHAIETMPGSRNGTLVNFSPLAPGEVRLLSHGDVVAVGRTVLVYWA